MNNNVDLTELISFGKYKGQPLSSIKDNFHYLKWCQNNLMDKDYFLKSSVYRAFFSNGVPGTGTGTVGVTPKKTESPVAPIPISIDDAYELLYQLPLAERIKTFLTIDFYKHLFQQISYQQSDSFFGLKYQVDENVVSRQWSVVLSLTELPVTLFQSLEEAKLKELLVNVPGFENSDLILNRISEFLRPLLPMNISNRKVVYNPVEISHLFILQGENVSYYQMGDLIQFAVEGRKEKFYNRDFSTFILYQETPSLTQEQADELGVLLLKKSGNSLVKDQINAHQRNLKSLREKVMLYQEEIRSIEDQISKLKKILPQVVTRESD